MSNPNAIRKTIYETLDQMLEDQLGLELLAQHESAVECGAWPKAIPGKSRQRVHVQARAMPDPLFRQWLAEHATQDDLRMLVTAVWALQAAVIKAPMDDVRRWLFRLGDGCLREAVLIGLDLLKDS